MCLFSECVKKRPLTPKSIIEGLSLLQSIPPTAADKQTQTQKSEGGSRKLLRNYCGLLSGLLLLFITGIKY